MINIQIEILDKHIVEPYDPKNTTLSQVTSKILR